MHASMESLVALPSITHGKCLRQVQWLFENPSNDGQKTISDDPFRHYAVGV